MHRIAIIGAGPAGCTLGRILGLSNIQFTIFESEASPTARGPGGTLDLHTQTGLAAVKAAGLHEEFLERARFDGEALIIADKNMKRYLDIGGTTSRSSGGRPEIHRRELRTMLLGSLPEGVVQWGRHLVSVSEDLTLHFNNGDESGFDLIIGADGAWSKTRALISDQLPIYTGISGSELTIRDAASRYPDLDALVNKGSIFSFGDGHAINAQYIGDGRIKVTEYGSREGKWATKNSSIALYPETLKTLLAKEYAGWAPELQKLISVADEEPVLTRALFMLPVGFKWENKPGVTVIGDAAHLMSPFAGEGANLAMADAMNLAEYIKRSASKDALYENVAAFEADMFDRAKPSQALSDQNLKDWFFTPGAPGTVIERFLVREVLVDEAVGVRCDYLAAALVC
ncbi:Monooxygenase [Lachnellula occidentalis]|uniref:Monooxygenase n=1 Tax=Lachnellula occidentalis TaxID=215460 RepID=A0A8H8UJY7_9HELO|nr:Monooxygenase [Lachnellula occidentalis]